MRNPKVEEEEEEEIQMLDSLPEFRYLISKSV
jgi:hypothetical protein